MRGDDTHSGAFAMVAAMAAMAALKRSNQQPKKESNMPPGQIQGRPPNYEAILKVFPMAYKQETIFAYAPDIYVPSGKPLSPALVAHESVHISRQMEMTVKAWWEKYLTDVEFRFNEELLAHRAEYQHMIQNATCRQMRRSALKLVAKRLASQLYGGLVSEKQAQEAIAA